MDFRHYLQQELLRRFKSNPRYSLRAFARALHVDSSELSRILNGKRAITRSMFNKLATQLQLPDSAREEFLLTVGACAEEAPPDYRQISFDSFQVVSEWHHLALLELTRVKGFQSRYDWAARALGISVKQTKEAVERLSRVGFLSIDDQGNWIDDSGRITTVGNEFTHAALRRFQRQVLEKAIRALEVVPVEERDQTTMTVAVSAKRLPEAKRRIKNFRRKLAAFLESSAALDRVYHLNISLYPVSHTASKSPLSTSLGSEGK